MKFSGLPEARASLRAGGTPTDYFHVRGLEAFGRFFDGELDTLPLFQSLETLRFNGRVVNKNVFALFARDEAVAFGGIEPFNCSAFSITHSVSSLPFRTLVQMILTSEPLVRQKAPASGDPGASDPTASPLNPTPLL